MEIQVNFIDSDYSGINIKIVNGSSVNQVFLWNLNTYGNTNIGSLTSALVDRAKTSSGIDISMPLSNDSPAIDFSKDLIIIGTSGPNSSDYAVAYLYNPHVITDLGISYSKIFANTSCGLSVDFVNFILQKKALELALEGNNYELACKYWKVMFGSDTNVTSTCGCNG